MTVDEAAEAMARILRDEVEPAALGAFLIVLRYRKETPEELAGFVRAARAVADLPTLSVDLDWPSYADRHKQMPYFILAARLLSRNGMRVLMHGLEGAGPVTTPKGLAALGIEPAGGADDAARDLDRDNFAYLPVETFCPGIASLFGLRSVLGVRSPANTFARMVNPGGAAYQMQGVFHPGYLEPHCLAAKILGQPNMAVFKGGGGEVQRNPEKPCEVTMLRNGEIFPETWPAYKQTERFQWREDVLDPARLAALWKGDLAAPAPEAAVIATAAVALKQLGRAATVEDADSLAAELWVARDRRL
jgi:anthranilate phosphoribosyltransferase